MHRMRCLTAFTVAATLAGSAQPSALASGGRPGPAIPPSDPQHRLRFSDDGADAKLVTQGPGAEPEFMLECDHGSGQVHLTRRGPGAATRRLVLSSGGARSELAVSAEAFEGGRWLFAEAATSDPALVAFRTSGRLDVSGGARGFAAVADPNVRLFFTACEQAA